MLDHSSPACTTELEARAKAIYERSKAEALDAARSIETLDTDYGELLIACGNRNAARSYYVSEYGVPYMDVLANREWMRVDLESIYDLAVDIAEGDPDDYGDEPVAYTWENCGWLFETCNRTDEGAIGFWRCRERTA